MESLMEPRSRTWHDLCAAIIAVALLLVVALFSDPPEPLFGAPSQRLVAWDQSAETAVQAAEDDVIVGALLLALGRDPLLMTARIDVHAIDGVVSLRGIVRDHGLRDHAERVATRIYGVRGVNNQLAVVGSVLT